MKILLSCMLFIIFTATIQLDANPHFLRSKKRSTDTIEKNENKKCRFEENLNIEKRIESCLLALAQKDFNQAIEGLLILSTLCDDDIITHLLAKAFFEKSEANEDSDALWAAFSYAKKAATSAVATAASEKTLNLEPLALFLVISEKIEEQFKANIEVATGQRIPAYVQHLYM